MGTLFGRLHGSLNFIFNFFSFLSRCLPVFREFLRGLVFSKTLTSNFSVTLWWYVSNPLHFSFTTVTVTTPPYLVDSGSDKSVRPFIKVYFYFFNLYMNVFWSLSRVPINTFYFKNFRICFWTCTYKYL